MVGVGATNSTTIGGVLIPHFGYHASFLGLAALAALTFLLLSVALPETLPLGGVTVSPGSGATNPVETKVLRGCRYEWNCAHRNSLVPVAN